MKTDFVEFPPLILSLKTPLSKLHSGTNNPKPHCFPKESLPDTQIPTPQNVPFLTENATSVWVLEVYFVNLT